MNMQEKITKQKNDGNAKFLNKIFHKQYDLSNLNPNSDPVAISLQSLLKLMGIKRDLNQVLNLVKKNDPAEKRLECYADNLNVVLHRLEVEAFDVKHLLMPYIIVLSTGELKLVIKKRGKLYQIDPLSGKKVRTNVQKNEMLFIYYVMPTFSESKINIKDFFRISFLHNIKPIINMLVCMLAVSLINPVISVAMGYLVKTGVADADIPLVIQLVGLLLVIMLGLISFQLFKSFFLLKFSIRMHYFIESAFMMRILTIPAYKLSKFSSGDLTARVSSAGTLAQSLVSSHITVVFSLLFSSTSLVVMFVYFPLMALGILSIYLTALLIGILIMAIQYRYDRAALDDHGEIVGFMNQAIKGIARLKVFSKEATANRIWQHKYSGFRRKLFITSVLGNYRGIVFIGVHSLVVAFYFWGFAYLYPKTGLNIESYFTFSASAIQFGMAFMGLSGAFSGVLSSFASYSRLKPLFELSADLDSQGVGRSKPKLKGNICINVLDFAYPGTQRKILDSVSLNISAGDFIGIIGASGAGKSTLMSVIMGIYPAADGKIKYDGVDLNEIDQNYLRKNMGIVLQDAKLLPATILENIIGISSNLTEDDANEALELVGLREFVRNLPMGFHTIINADSESFSKGQKQLILFARALVNKPKILVLDEATSALDSVAQKIVTDSIRKMNITRIVIAHRYETIEMADKIYRVIDGRVELIDKSKLK